MTKSILTLLASTGSLIIGSYFISGYSTSSNTKNLLDQKGIQCVSSDQLKCGPYDMSVIFGRYIFFSDNNAVGMRAYIKIDDKELELERYYNDPKSAGFKIPKEIFNSDKGYEVRAVDRHNNITLARIYTLEGVVSKESFID